MLDFDCVTSVTYIYSFAQSHRVQFLNFKPFQNNQNLNLPQSLTDNLSINKCVKLFVHWNSKQSINGIFFSFSPI